jgi:hypothetical protein
MGTSASNGGPKGSAPLLPDWFNPESPNQNQGDESSPDQSPGSDVDNGSNENSNAQQPREDNTEEQSQENQSSSWGKSKGALTRLANSRSGASYAKAAKSYVGSLGGSRGATKAAAQGIRTGGKYANFLGSIASGGINNALHSLGLDQFVGKSSEEICLAIADSIAPIGTTNDEAIARDALISTLDSLYTKIQEAGNDFTSIDSLNAEQVKETLIEFVSNYIFNKWMYELGNAIEKGNVSESEAITLEIEVKDLISLETTQRYRDVPIETFNINDRANNIMIEEIFQTAYTTLEE